MVIESPSCHCIVAFAARLADVVHQCCPAKPEVVAHSANVVEHLKGMVKIILMCPAAHSLHHIHVGKFGKNEPEEPAAM